ncbi:MAG: tRNA lysidine(34) synthetase TilS [Treponema sp.]|nr:tRNA lysidine(34) synthetase TilS [Treponema sp.]
MVGVDFERAVACVLDSFREESPSPRILWLASVSGGADSVALLSALVALRDRDPGFRLRCVHVEHGIRAPEESAGDADFVRSLCGELGVPCRVFSVRPGRVAEFARKRGLGIEAAARHFRRRAWSRETDRLRAEGFPNVRILTAHTADDLLETVLMRVLRGSGPAGLAGITPASGDIVRPLLGLGRRDVLAYLGEKKISWREDSTNADTRYLRNRIRHRLVPVLEENFPRWRTGLASMAETQALASDFIVGEANSRVKWEVVSENPDKSGLFPGPESPSLRTDEANFFSRPEIVREEALFQGIDLLFAVIPSDSGDDSGEGRSIRRATVREFSRGTLAAADLGLVHLRRKNGIIVISPRRDFVGRPERYESGFTLLIIDAGFYNVGNAAIEVRSRICGRPLGDGTFPALLPVAVRPPLNEDRIAGRTCGRETRMTVADSLGVAAFIDEKGFVLRKREEPDPARREDAGDMYGITIRPKER